LGIKILKCFSSVFTGEGGEVNVKVAEKRRVQVLGGAARFTYRKEYFFQRGGNGPKEAIRLPSKTGWARKSKRFSVSKRLL